MRLRFETTLASIGDGVIATALDGRVTFLNRVATQLTGWSAEAEIAINDSGAPILKRAPSPEPCWCFATCARRGRGRPISCSATG